MNTASKPDHPKIFITVLRMIAGTGIFSLQLINGINIFSDILVIASNKKGVFYG
jgi:hypothetical protein